MNAGRVSKIAIVDDEADIRAALQQMLEIEGLSPIGFAEAHSALAQIDAAFPGIVIADLRMPGMDGQALLDRLLRCDPELPVIMISGHGDIATAVDLVKQGAYDFLSKPFDGAALAASVHRALDKRSLVLENRTLQQRPAAAVDGAIIGESPEMERLVHTLNQLAQADIDVLLTGESGVGKSLIASALHRRSLLGRKAMTTMDCSAIPAEHGESLLFGHVSGAFAGAQFPRTGQLMLADGGTMFLDHVDALTPPLQTRVKQVLEDHKVLPMGGHVAQTSRFRTISATSADIDAMVLCGTFDRSLFFRLCGYRLEIPPLRARRGDVTLLFRAFLAQSCATLGRDMPTLSPAIWRRLHDHDWPGNVRELRSFADNVALGLGENVAARRPSPGDNDQIGLKQAVADYEQAMIRETLNRFGGDIAMTIAALQIPRKTFYDKLARHGINPDEYRPIPRARTAMPQSD